MPPLLSIVPSTATRRGHQQFGHEPIFVGAIFRGAPWPSVGGPWTGAPSERADYQLRVERLAVIQHNTLALLSASFIFPGARQSHALVAESNDYYEGTHTWSRVQFMPSAGNDLPYLRDELPLASAAGPLAGVPRATSSCISVGWASSPSPAPPTSRSSLSGQPIPNSV